MSRETVAVSETRRMIRDVLKRIATIRRKLQACGASSQAAKDLARMAAVETVAVAALSETDPQILEQLMIELERRCGSGLA